MTYILHHQCLKIANTLKFNYKLNVIADYHLGAKHPNDPGGAMACQLQKYLEELH